MAVVGGIITYILAATTADPLVVDDYYKEGLAINQDLDREHKARDLGIKGDVQFDPSANEFRVVLTGKEVERLPYIDLALVHPTRAGEDETIRLPSVGAGIFALHHGAPANVRWHVQLTPPDGSWKLQGRLPLPAQHRIQLG